MSVSAISLSSRIGASLASLAWPISLHRLFGSAESIGVTTSFIVQKCRVTGERYNLSPILIGDRHLDAVLIRHQYPVFLCITSRPRREINSAGLSESGSRGEQMEV